MIRTATYATLGFMTISAAQAEPRLERVRGTIDTATETSVTVSASAGKKEVTLAPDTKFAYVAKSSLDKIGEGKFIGVATKGDTPVALEVVIFPDSMKGTAEGHYAWDSIRDTTGTGKGVAKSSMTNGTVSGGMTKSAMTNGTVKSGGMTKSAMTNGTVKSGNDKKFTISYDNGKTFDITVPPSAPIVEFEPADKSILKPGGKLFAVTAKEGDKLTGKLVAVGKDGVTPPM